MTKKEFSEYIEKAMEECRSIYKETKSYTEKMYSSAMKENMNKSAIGLYTLENDPEYMYNKYMERLALSKLDRLYSLLKEAARERMESMSDEDIEEYREEKQAEISEEINRKMLKFEALTDEMARLVIKDSIDELIIEQKRVRTCAVDEIKSSLIEKLGISKTVSNIAPLADDEAKVLANISRDKETLTRFFKLLEEYRNLQSDVKTIGIERVIIARDLIPSNMNFSLSDINEEELFSDETFDKIQKQISIYIQSAVDEETVESMYFSNVAEESYYALKSTSYKYSDEIPHDEKALKHFKSIITDRLYELAQLQNQEWERLHNKMFKTNETTSRIASLSSEIDETKELINHCIIEKYKEHYSNNDIYGSISTRINGKLEYALGRESLEDFYNTGIWPTKEQIDALKRARELNKKEAEKCVIRVEVAKEKFSGLQERALNNKNEKIELVRKEMTDLVGNWENPTILNIINSGIRIDEKPITKPVQEESTNKFINETEELLIED